MRNLFLAAAAALPLLATAALAQQQPSVADRAVMLSLALQKAGVEAQGIAADAQLQLRAATNRVAELEKLCGDPCKAKPEDAPK